MWRNSLGDWCLNFKISLILFSSKSKPWTQGYHSFNTLSCSHKSFESWTISYSSSSHNQGPNWVSPTVVTIKTFLLTSGLCNWWLRICPNCPVTSSAPSPPWARCWWPTPPGPAPGCPAPRRGNFGQSSEFCIKNYSKSCSKREIKVILEIWNPLSQKIFLIKLTLIPCCVTGVVIKRFSNLKLKYTLREFSKLLETSLNKNVWKVISIPNGSLY